MLWLNISKKYLLYLLMLITGSVTLVFAYNAVISEAETGPYYFSDTTVQQVAFSLEVSWGEGNLSEILEILEKADVKSSFFINGSWLSSYPREAEKILVKGHEIGKHSFSAIPYTQLTEEEIASEFVRFNELTGDTLEYRPRLFRPPVGVYNEFIIDVANRYGYRTVLWSIDSNDHMVENKEEIIDRVSEKLHCGAIINFRTVSNYLPEVLPVIISYVRESGYEIVTVSELIGLNSDLRE